MSAISITGLRKTYGSTVALNGLTLNVDEGEVHGFLGPNGAGKSTTIRILLGLIRKNSGEVTVLGRDPWREAAEVHRQLAYVPGDVALWSNLTGGEIIDLLGRLRGGIDAARRTKLLERFDLDPTKKGRSYSKGNRQMVALVAALSSDARLLLLDEPTSGLDPLMEKVFEDCLAEVKAQGRTVLLSSHILSEVEATADRVSIIRAGEVVETGSLAQLRQLTRSRLRAGVQRTPSSAEVEGWPGVHDVVLEPQSVSLAVDGARVGEVVGRLGGFGILSLTCAPPSLEELFLSRYEQVS